MAEVDLYDVEWRYPYAPSGVEWSHAPWQTGSTHLPVGPAQALADEWRREGFHCRLNLIVDDKPTGNS